MGAVAVASPGSGAECCDCDTRECQSDCLAALMRQLLRAYTRTVVRHALSGKRICSVILST